MTMTEEEWENWRDPRVVIHWLLANIHSPFCSAFSHRKMVLFGVACCRRIEDRWNDPRVREAVEAAELYCDARTNEQRAIVKPIRIRIREDREWAGSTLGRLAKSVIGKSGWAAALECSWEASRRVGGATFWSDEERFAQGPMLRDIIGNPFRPVPFSRSWRTATAILLARQMYESREFSAMPILADALQDAGCNDEHILNHCRDASQVHVRGCWVVDLVLGKS
jgi:hypothetical protein